MSEKQWNRLPSTAVLTEVEARELTAVEGGGYAEGDCTTPPIFRKFFPLPQPQPVTL